LPKLKGFITFVKSTVTWVPEESIEVIDEYVIFVVETLQGLGEQPPILPWKRVGTVRTKTD